MALQPRPSVSENPNRWFAWRRAPAVESGTSLGPVCGARPWGHKVRMFCFVKIFPVFPQHVATTDMLSRLWN